MQAIAENTTHFLTAKGMEDYGKTMNKSWAEIIDPPKRTKEEIAFENVNIEDFTSEMFDRIRGRRAKE